MTIAILTVLAALCGIGSAVLIVTGWGGAMRWARERTRRNPPARFVVGSLLAGAFLMFVILIIELIAPS